MNFLAIPLDLHLYHVSVFASSGTSFDNLMEEYHFACCLLKVHRIIDIILPHITSNFLDIFAMVDGLLDGLKSF